MQICPMRVVNGMLLTLQISLYVWLVVSTSLQMETSTILGIGLQVIRLLNL